MWYDVGATDGSHADGSREAPEEEITDSRNCKYSYVIIKQREFLASSCFWHLFLYTKQLRLDATALKCVTPPKSAF